MNTFKRGYRLAIRTLLLAGYLILFASQFNGRYFSIANFYVYGSAAANGDATGLSGMAMRASVSHPDNVQKHARFIDNAQRLSHLSIDKRFHFRGCIRLPLVRAPGAPEYILMATRYYSHTPGYSSSDHPTIALRGPPCV